MNVYIAGKITGVPDYKDKFNIAEKKLSNEGHICMNPSVLPGGFHWEKYIPICYSMIDACDAIYLLSNWKDSKGAVLEFEYAWLHNKEIRYEEGPIVSESKIL